MTIFMPTSVHIPKPLLDAVDRKARALHVSRNQLILRALEREMAEPTGWPPEFFERLADVDEDTKEAVDEMQRTIRAGRRSKAPPRL
jgi:hypothetical protein